MEELSPESRLSIVLPALWENVGRIAKAVDEKFGAEGRDLLRQVQSEYAADMGKILKPMSPDGDSKSVATFIAGGRKTYSLPEVKIEIEKKGDGVVVRASRCAYGQEAS